MKNKLIALLVALAAVTVSFAATQKSPADNSNIKLSQVQMTAIKSWNLKPSPDRVYFVEMVLSQDRTELVNVAKQFKQ